jgi:hypothetical protein
VIDTHLSFFIGWKACPLASESPDSRELDSALPDFDPSSKLAK